MNQHNRKRESPWDMCFLSELTCGSSGDNFVSMMEYMPKVAVVGRPTKAILDYANSVMLN